MNEPFIWGRYIGFHDVGGKEKEWWLKWDGAVSWACESHKRFREASGMLIALFHFPPPAGTPAA